MVSAVQGSIIAREAVSSGQGGRSCRPGENPQSGWDMHGSGRKISMPAESVIKL
jgi:hypothetical protein